MTARERLRRGAGWHSSFPASSFIPMPDVLEPPVSSRTEIPPSRILAAKLAVMRRRQIQVWLGTGAARVAGACVVLFAVEMLADLWLDMPWGLRLAFLALNAGVLGALAWRDGIRPVVRQPNDDAFALMVEKARPEFSTRLIASIQLTRPGALPAGAAGAMVEKMVGQTEAMAAPMDFASVVRTEELRRSGGWALGILAAGLMLFVTGREVAPDLMRRAFLSRVDVPRKTRVACLTQHIRVGRGDSVTVEAAARGVIPAEGRLIVRGSFMRDREYVMAKDPADATRTHYTKTLESVQSSFSYYVRLNDGQSGLFQVTVVPRPILASMECEQIPPAYSGLPRAKRALGDLALLAGSRLKLSAVASKDLRTAALRLTGTSNEVALTVNPKNPREVTGEIPIPARGLSGFSALLLDTEGMESRDSAVYHIEIVPDRAPTVRILLPDRKEELVTREAALLLAFHARDDFQIARARIRYKRSEAEDAEIKTVELDMGTNAAPELRRRFEWRVSELTPPLLQGSRLEFWIEVQDNNDVTGPGIGVSDHQLVRVVSADEKRADLLNRAGDYLGTIGDVAGDQERLNQNLGAFILEKRQ